MKRKKRILITIACVVLVLFIQANFKLTKKYNRHYSGFSKGLFFVYHSNGYLINLPYPVSARYFPLVSRIYGADVASFQVINFDDKNTDGITDFAKDKNAVYYRNHKIRGADPDTFRAIGDHYGADSDNVYYGYGSSRPIIVVGADPKTFGRRKGSDFNYYCDKDNCYHEGKLIKRKF